MPQDADHPLAWIDDEISLLDDAQLRRYLRVRGGPQGATIELDGRQLINFGSNDYLGLAGDERLVAAATGAAKLHGWGSGSSPLICGHTAEHRDLEQKLARFEQTEAALVFPSGFAANVGTITALVGRGDAVFSDAKNHASLIDGCRLSRADVHIYQHGDCQHLQTLLQKATGVRRRLIVTDTLFSMDGDLPPLQELVDLRQRYGCMLMIDEAHATGVFGKAGRGVAEHLSVEPFIDVKVGTLSKALGCGGGFVCGSEALVQWLVNRARPYVFSTAQPAAAAAAAAAALQIVESEPNRRAELLERARDVRQELKRAGWDTGASASQIIPLRIGDVERTMWLGRQLAELGFFVPGIRPPTVPAGQSLLRLSLSWHHTPETIQRLLLALSTLQKESV